MINLSWLSKEKAIELLKKLKLYSNLTKTIWLQRAKKEFDLLESWKSFYKVQYFSSMNRDDAEQQAIWLYKKVFWEELAVDQILFEASEDIQWWIRLFKNHKLLDMSFKNIAKKMK